MGTSLHARARVQINLAVSQVVDIKQVATFPDIVFPIMWFEEGIDGLPTEVTNLMNLATSVPPVAHVALSAVLFGFGALLLITAVWRLVRGAHSISSLHLAAGHVRKSIVTCFSLSVINFFLSLPELIRRAATGRIFAHSPRTILFDRPIFDRGPTLILVTGEQIANNREQFYSYIHLLFYYVNV